MHTLYKERIVKAFKDQNLYDSSRIEVMTPNATQAALWNSFLADRRSTIIHKKISVPFWVTQQGDRNPAITIAIDPGETTGWAIYCGGVDGDELEGACNNAEWWVCGQTRTKTFEEGLKLAQALDFIASLWQPHWICYCIEDYKVYGYKADSHKWEQLYTSQLIGLFKGFWVMRSRVWHTQMAAAAKKWVTDERLESLGIYAKGVRHGRDATRHIVSSLLFCDKISKGDKNDT